MKPTKYILQLTIVTTLFLVSCTSNCPDDAGTRPEFTEEHLKWIKVQNKTPYFKITRYDAKGAITHIDTVQGQYKDTLYTETIHSKNECGFITYQVAKNILNLKIDNIGYGGGIKMINSSQERTHGFTASISSDEFTEKTVLDTAVINGKSYKDVYKTKKSKTFYYYYAKDIGLIYMKSPSDKEELLP